MNYIEWVDRVLAAFMRRWGLIPTTSTACANWPSTWESKDADSAIHTAVEDLDALGLVDARDNSWIKEVQNTRMVRAGGIGPSRPVSLASCASA